MLNDKINAWILDADSGLEIQKINRLIEYLAAELYCHYEPTIGPFPDFWQRLDKWLNNVPDESDQKNLFRLVKALFFIGPKEMDALNRSAFRGPIARWLVDQTGLMLDNPDLPSAIQDELEHTWICPITDSARINKFYHLNHIAGRNFRPEWNTLRKFSDKSTVQNYIKSQAIRNVVLVEDFVGSGTQILPALNFAGEISGPDILIVPLVLSPQNSTFVDPVLARFPHITMQPMLMLGSHEFIKQRSTEPPIHVVYRALATDTYSLVLGGKSDAESKLYGPLGFEDTGGLIVLWTNCPDNTLPMVYHDSLSWRPLFPRASRL